MISSSLQPTVPAEREQWQPASTVTTPYTSTVYFPTASSLDTKSSTDKVVSNKTTSTLSAAHEVLCPKEKADTLVAEISIGSASELKTAAFPSESGQPKNLKQLVEWYTEQNQPAEGFYLNPFSR